MFGVIERTLIMELVERPFRKYLVVEDREGRPIVKGQYVGHISHHEVDVVELPFEKAWTPVKRDKSIAYLKYHGRLNPIPYSPEDWVQEGSLVLELTDKGEVELVGQFFLRLTGERWLIWHTGWNDWKIYRPNDRTFVSE